MLSQFFVSDNVVFRFVSLATRPRSNIPTCHDPSIYMYVAHKQYLVEFYQNIQANFLLAQFWTSMMAKYVPCEDPAGNRTRDLSSRCRRENKAHATLPHIAYNHKTEQGEQDSHILQWLREPFPDKKPNPLSIRRCKWTLLVVTYS